MSSSEMWRRWGEWQKYDARGMKGPEALVQEINRIVYEAGVKSPITTKRGQSARLNYLDSGPGREALRRQGVADRRMKDWFSGKTSPSADGRRQLDNAYWERKRENMVRSGQLKKLLNNNGFGCRMEIYPVDQSQVDEKRARPNVTERSLQVRYVWDDLVDAYAAHDEGAIEEIWEDIITDLDSDWAAYAYVSAVSLGV